MGHAFIASAFVAARASSAPLREFPGLIPQSLTEAYAVQKAGIALWPDSIAGWKVAKIAPSFIEPGGVDRLIGPVFSRTIVPADGEIPFPVITGGAGAVEAELIMVLGKDAEPDIRWTADTARHLITQVHIGVEIAGSPLATCSALGPKAMICGLGNNLGLIIGAEIPDWRQLSAEIGCTSTIDGAVVGTRSVSADLRVPLEALALALNQAAELDQAMRAGQCVSTGAITGVHPITAGQEAEACFGEFGSIRCVAVAANARSLGPRSGR